MITARSRWSQATVTSTVADRKLHGVLNRVPRPCRISRPDHQWIADRFGRAVPHRRGRGARQLSLFPLMRCAVDRSGCSSTPVRERAAADIRLVRQPPRVWRGSARSRCATTLVSSANSLSAARTSPRKIAITADGADGLPSSCAAAAASPPSAESCCSLPGHPVAPGIGHAPGLVGDRQRYRRRWERRDDQSAPHTEVPGSEHGGHVRRAGAASSIAAIMASRHSQIVDLRIALSPRS